MTFLESFSHLLWRDGDEMPLVSSEILHELCVSKRGIVKNEECVCNLQVMNPIVENCVFGSYKMPDPRKLVDSNLDGVLLSLTTSSEKKLHTPRSSSSSSTPISAQNCQRVITYGQLIETLSTWSNPVSHKMIARAVKDAVKEGSLGQKDILVVCDSQSNISAIALISMSPDHIYLEYLVSDPEKKGGGVAILRNLSQKLFFSNDLLYIELFGDEDVQNYYFKYNFKRKEENSNVLRLYKDDIPAEFL